MGSFVDQFSPEQVATLSEMLDRGMLKGERADVVREIVRRWGNAPSGDTERAGQIAELANSGTGAFMHSFANAATLGLADKAVGLINDGVRKLGFDPLTPEEIAHINGQQAAEHPYADAAGSVAGTVAGGVAGGGAAAKLGLKPAASFAGRIGQYGAAGAGAGAAEQMIHDGQMYPRARRPRQRSLAASQGLLAGA